MIFLEKLKTWASVSAFAFLFFFPIYAYLNALETAKDARAEDSSASIQADDPGVPATLFPVDGRSTADVISVFGDQRGNRRHQGIDIAAPKGTAVLAVVAGRIQRLKNGGNGGKQIWLIDEAEQRTFFYAHLDRQLVAVGDRVTAGSVIGTVGNTGNANRTRPHLHFEIQTGRRHSVDPMPFLQRTQP